MKERVFFLLKFFLLTVIIFIVGKCGFMVYNHDAATWTMADMLEVIGHGLSLDVSTALYFLIIPFFVAWASIWLPMPRWLMKPYYIFVAIAFSLAFVYDTCLYPYWHFKLDALCLQYLETPSEAMASVSTGYILLLLLALIVVAVIISLAYIYVVPVYRLKKGHWWESFLFVLLIPVMVIAIRGGLDESTTNIGQVYYSQNQFLNHSAVNPVFSFLSSFEKTASYVPDYQFMDDDECEAMMQGLYPTTSENPDTLLTTQRPNVVVILMESCGGVFTQDIGGKKEVMPNLNRLESEGVYFSRFYANSYRTDRGTLCTWSGYPSFPRSSVMKMPAKTRLLPGIAGSMLREGYTTSYLYGGDINFTNMRGYLVNIGFEDLYWKTDYTLEEQETAEWGVRDDITFKTLSQMVEQKSQQEKPFLIGYSTLSSHEPWDVPTHRLDDEILNAFNYLDECIGNFISEMKKSPAWDNLLIILLPDHGYSYGEVGEEHPMHDHVPMLWLGGAVKEPRRITQICNQTDLPATLLGQLGIDHQDYHFSRDVLSKNYTYPFATHTYNNGISMVDSTGFAVLDLNANMIVTDQSTDAQALIKKGKAILQMATRELKNMK
ncbi:alkaline phosphatase family protein [uncultured Prevotella sp.]|uniref:LTA synthase family protein n=1 Tax=uncultured Prevotella sp. TaxID=159272 RepID=UPI0025DD49EE|nr:alkaline phosphatase family protein [uncultured Prevotella sp.]